MNFYRKIPGSILALLQLGMICSFSISNVHGQVTDAGEKVLKENTVAVKVPRVADKDMKRKIKSLEAEKEKNKTTQTSAVQKAKNSGLAIEWMDVKRADLSANRLTSKDIPDTYMDEATEQELESYVPMSTRLQTTMAVPKNSQQTWEVRYRDVSIRRMLQRWANDAQYQLIWESGRDFPIEIEVVIHGDFRDGVGTVMESLSQTDYPVQALINSALRQVRVVRYLKGQAK